MASQTLPNTPLYTAGTAIKGFFNGNELAIIQQIIMDLTVLRNAVDALNTLFLAHTHKVPSGALAAQSSAPDNTTAAGGAATAPTANTAPASIVSSN